MSNEADMKAIDDFMRRTAPVTPEATALRNSWLTWYPSLSWWALNYDTSVRDEASTRRNKFNLANAQTKAEKDNVIRVITTGFDSNQMQGKARKETLPTGEVGTQIKKPTPAAILQGSHPVIKQGSKGPAVIEWQKILGTTADGNFGPNTKALTIAFQKKKGLTADGVVGAKTWTAALGNAAADAAPVKVEEPGFLASLNPFASSPSSTPAKTASVIKPTPKPTVKPAAKPQAKPASVAPAQTSTPSAVASTGGSAPTVKTNPIQVAQAGMFDALDKVPLWVKIAGFVGAVGVLVFGLNAKMVDYSTGRQVKRRRAA